MRCIPFKGPTRQVLVYRVLPFFRTARLEIYKMFYIVPPPPGLDLSQLYEGGGGGVSHYSDYTAESEVSTTHIDIEVFLGEAFCAFLMDSVTRFLVLHGFCG